MKQEKLGWWAYIYTVIQPKNMCLHQINFIFILPRHEKIEKYIADLTGNYWNTHLFYFYTKATNWNMVMKMV